MYGIAYHEGYNKSKRTRGICSSKVKCRKNPCFKTQKYPKTVLASIIKTITIDDSLINII